MSTEVKVWLVIGLVVIVFAVWWWARNPSDQKPDLSMNATTMKPAETLAPPSGADSARPAADESAAASPAPARGELRSLDELEGETPPAEPWRPPPDVLGVAPPERRLPESRAAIDEPGGLSDPALGAGEPESPAHPAGATSGDRTSGDVELKITDGSTAPATQDRPATLPAERGAALPTGESAGDRPPPAAGAQPGRDSANVGSGGATVPSVPRRYRIQDGDTLMKIAREMYDDERHWTAIKAANPGIDERRLIVGHELVVPPLNLPSAPPASADSAGGARREPTSQPVRIDRALYVVAEGDTLTSIAREVLGNENRWPEIFELNRDKLKSPNAIYAGMQLKLPAK